MAQSLGELNSFIIWGPSLTLHSPSLAPGSLVHRSVPKLHEAHHGHTRRQREVLYRRENLYLQFHSTQTVLLSLFNTLELVNIDYHITTLEPVHVYHRCHDPISHPAQ